ncbi:MAG TPA: hypothetical protein PK564_03335 [bacterium]|nr:hypothetical protein [bacterium]
MKPIEKIIRSLYGIGTLFNQANVLAWYFLRHEPETGILKYDPNYGTDFTPDNVLEPTTNLDPAYVKLGIVVTTNYLFIKIGVSPFSVKLTYALKSGELHRVEPDDYNIACEGWMAYHPWKKEKSIEQKIKKIMSSSNYFVRMPNRIFKKYHYLVDKYNNLEF